MDFLVQNIELSPTMQTMTKPASGNHSEYDRTRLDFAEAASRSFSFLADLGFAQVEASPTIVRYRKGSLEAAVYHGRKSCELGFEIGRAAKRYAMSALVWASDPETAKQYRNYAATTPDILAEGLARLARLVRRHGQRALEDDPEFFVVLESLQKSWAEGYALDVLEGQLRPKAEEAFRRGDYREAAELYERIRPRLTPSELKKLAIARGRARG